MGDPNNMDEIPEKLKHLARIVAQNFYTTDQFLIIDLLTKNICMKEDDMAELLCFDQRRLRIGIGKLQADKFVQTRVKFETTAEGRLVKINYCFIPYKSFINVVKYKLEWIKRRLDNEGRNEAAITHFICVKCGKTYTDLEADQLFNVQTGEFCCTFCMSPVEENDLSKSRVELRLKLGRYNEQHEPLFQLLQEIDQLRLPTLSDPEIVTIHSIKGGTKGRLGVPDPEASKHQLQFGVNEDGNKSESKVEKKPIPVWLLESTVNNGGPCPITNDDHKKHGPSTVTSIGNIGIIGRRKKENVEEEEPDEIMSFLQKFEKNSAACDSSDEDCDMAEDKSNSDSESSASSDSDSDTMEETDDAPLVNCGGVSYPLNKIDAKVVGSMTDREKENYIHVYQQYYSHSFG